MSNWQERTNKEQRIVIYSNRPPKEFKGGAVKAIADLSVDMWVGPSDKPIPDAVWEKMSDEEKHKLTGPQFLTFNDKTIKVYTFPISQSMLDAQYIMMSNELIWPIFHSADADALVDPLKMANPRHKHNYSYQYNEHKNVETIINIKVKPNNVPDGSFNPDHPQFKPEKDFLDIAHETIHSILNNPQFEIFHPHHGKHRVIVQQNLDGIEVDFSGVHKTIGDPHAHENLQALKREIRTALRTLEEDNSINPEVDRHDSKAKAMKTHIETESKIIITPRDPEKDYLLYKELNELGNQAIAQLRKNGEISGHDVVWVHDYQCANAKGDIYSFHIPFPSLEFLQKVKVNDKDILASEYFPDLLQQMANHQVMTFQRAIDMKNFIEVVAAIDPKFKTLNPQAYSNGQVKDFDIDESISLRMFSKQVKIMNIPIDVAQGEVLSTAQNDNLDQTTYDPKMLDNMNLPYDRSRMANGRVPLKAVLGNILNTDEEHRIIFSMHRNDYSKNTLEKIYAAGNYLAKHPEEKGKTHFLFSLQPTRAGVPGEERYQKAVETMAKGLREQWGDSIIVIPAHLEWSDFLGLNRHPNTVAYLGVGRKDGHDLTLREAASTRADFPAGDPRAALAIVTTNGTGASDVLRGTKDNPGAFVLNSNNKSFVQMHTELTKVFEEIVNLARTPEGKKILADRYHVASTQSRKYDPEHFRETALKVLEQGRARESA